MSNFHIKDGFITTLPAPRDATIYVRNVKFEEIKFKSNFKPNRIQIKSQIKPKPNQTQIKSQIKSNQIQTKFKSNSIQIKQQQIQFKFLQRLESKHQFVCVVDFAQTRHK